MSSSTLTQFHAIFLTLQGVRGINEVLTVGSPPALTPMGILLTNKI